MIKKMCVGLVAVLAACSSVTGSGSNDDNSPDVRLEVSGELFVRGTETGGANVPFLFTNRGTEAVLVPRCGDVLLLQAEKAQGSTWASYSGGFCQTNLAMSPLRVEPGESVQGTFGISDTGRFRLRVVAGCDCSTRVGYPAQTRAFDVR